MAKIHELIGEIARGDIQLPEFQRGYVWSRDQVREFIKSLYLQRPSGHLLEWHAHRPVAVRGQPGGNGRRRLLLDGQQRLTSLFVLFTGKAPPFYEGESLFFDLYFNVQTAEFRFYQKSVMANNPVWRSVHEVLRDGLPMMLTRLSDLSEAEREVIQDARHLATLAQLDQIRNYAYDVDELKDDRLSVDDVVDIFNNVNSGGTKLSRADLAIAHVCAEWPEARSEVREFSRQMKHYGFEIEPELLVRAMAGVADGVATFTPAFSNVSIEKMKESWPKVRAAYENLVNELRHHAYIDSIGDLASPIVLVPMIVYLARRGGHFASAGERDRMLRWMFLANVWSRYAGQTDTKVQRDVRIICDNQEPVQLLCDQIIQDRGRLKVEARDLEGKGPQTALYKFAYVVARARNAVDWFTGTLLYAKAIGKSNGLESHHIFPQAVLTRNGYDSRESRKIVNEVANRAFLTMKANRTISSKTPVSYLPKVEERFPGALQAQCVPMDDDLWKVNHYEEFLRQRRVQLAKAMNQVLDRLAHEEIGATVPAAVTELLSRDEAQDLEFKSSLRTEIPGGDVNKDLEKVVVKTVAGFLNTGGGNLLLGVNNDRQVIGLAADYDSLSREGRDVRDTFQLHLTNLLSRALEEPTLSFITITCHDIRGKDICQIRVIPSDHPVYVQDRDTSIFYVRIGPQTRALPLQHVVRYVSSHWGEGESSWMPSVEEFDSAGPDDDEITVGEQGWAPDDSAFAQLIASAPKDVRPELKRLLDWVHQLQAQGLIREVWSHGGKNTRILPYPRGDTSGWLTIWADGSMSLWRSVFERAAPESIERIEGVIAPVKLGRGHVVRLIPDELLDALTDAYREAAARGASAASV